MKSKSLLFTFLFIGFSSLAIGQNKEINSSTRMFIDAADYTQINKDWNIKAEFFTGLGESVSFYPIEVIDLKTNKLVKSIQMDMKVFYENRGKTESYIKSSWIDLDEIEEFTYFIETYVVPNLNTKLEKNKSSLYTFQSKEIYFEFLIEGNTKRISIRLNSELHYTHEPYFWTQNNVNKITDLLHVLKLIK